MNKIVLFLFAGLITVASLAAPVCSDNRENAALIVIDMQEMFVTRGGNHKTLENKTKVEQVIKEQIATINDAKKAHIPIIFMEYEDFGDTTSALKAAVQDYKDVKFIKKDTDGMLEDGNKYRKELADYLTKNNIGTLVITGANGGACVKRSIQGALNNNCLVVAYNKGIADFNYKDFIYPYVGHYDKIKDNCKNCVFREVSSVGSLTQYMLKSSEGRSPTGSSSNSTNSNSNRYEETSQ